MKVTDNLRETIDNMDRKFLLEENLQHKAIKDLVSVCAQYGRFLMLDLDFGDTKKRVEVRSSYQGLN